MYRVIMSNTKYNYYYYLVSNFLHHLVFQLKNNVFYASDKKKHKRSRFFRFQRMYIYFTIMFFFCHLSFKFLSI